MRWVAWRLWRTSVLDPGGRRQAGGSWAARQPWCAKALGGMAALVRRRAGRHGSRGAAGHGGHGVSTRRAPVWSWETQGPLAARVGRDLAGQASKANRGGLHVTWCAGCPCFSDKCQHPCLSLARFPCYCTEYQPPAWPRPSPYQSPPTPLVMAQKRLPCEP